MTEQTFKIQVFSCKDKMYRFAKRLLISTEEAEDVVQELMVKFWKNREDLTQIQNIEAYLMKSVKYECLNRLRHHKVVMEFQKEHPVEIKTAENHQSTEIKEWILKWIEKLPDKQKLVIHLRDIEEYSVNEITEILEMEENAVRVNLMRARQKIKENLQKLFKHENERLQQDIY